MGTTAETIRDIYAKWRLRDVAGAAALLADDFCFMLKVPSDLHPLGGACHGREETSARLAGILEEFDFLAYDVGPLMVNGELAAAEVNLHYRHRPSGEDYRTTLGHFWTVHNGKAARLIEYHDIDVVRDFVARVSKAA